MWFRRTKPLIGIDIGSHAIKLVRFALTGSSYQLLDLALLPIPPDAVVDGVIGDLPAVQGMLRRLITLQNITDNDVALALSGHSVIVKKVQMVRMSEEELANAMPYEAEQHIPFDVYDVNTDFQILSATDANPNRSGQMEVLLAAAKKGRVDELSQVARGANLSPAVIDVDMLALINAFELNYPDEMPGHVVCLVHLGASMMTVLILKDGLSIFQRDIGLGGNQYTAALQKALDLSLGDAQLVGVSPEDGAVDPDQGDAVPGDQKDMAKASAQERIGVAVASLQGERAIGPRGPPDHHCHVSGKGNVTSRANARLHQQGLGKRTGGIQHDPAPNLELPSV